MTKKVTIAAKPTGKTLDPDQWVTATNTQSVEQPLVQPQESQPSQVSQAEIKLESTTRFTIDIPTNLHRFIKSDCALRGVKMNEEIRKLLEAHFLKQN